MMHKTSRKLHWARRRQTVARPGLVTPLPPEIVPSDIFVAQLRRRILDLGAPATRITRAA